MDEPLDLTRETHTLLAWRRKLQVGGLTTEEALLSAMLRVKTYLGWLLAVVVAVVLTNVAVGVWIVSSLDR